MVLRNFWSLLVPVTGNPLNVQSMPTRSLSADGRAVAGVFLLVQDASALVIRAVLLHCLPPGRRKIFYPL